MNIPGPAALSSTLQHPAHCAASPSTPQHSTAQRNTAPTAASPSTAPTVQHRPAQRPLFRIAQHHAHCSASPSTTPTVLHRPAPNRLCRLAQHHAKPTPAQHRPARSSTAQHRPAPRRLLLCAAPIGSGLGVWDAPRECAGRGGAGPGGGRGGGVNWPAPIRGLAGFFWPTRKKQDYNRRF